MLKPAIASVMDGLQTRRRQLATRLVIGAAIAASFGPSLGWWTTGLWLLAWYLIQGLETRWLDKLSRAPATASAGDVNVALAIVLATNLVFNFIAARAVLSGEAWLPIAGVWLMTGALLNAVAMSRASTALYVVGAAPTVITAVAVFAVAMRGGASPEALLAVGAGGGLLMVAAVVLRGLSLEAYLEAQRASEAKSLFLANMSHEIRTPLNGVLGMVQAMKMEPIPDRLKERLDIIQRSSESLLSLLNDVLDQSKVEAGKLELGAAPFDLERLVGDLEEVFGSLCAHKDVVLETKVSASARGLWEGDALRLRQVLSNLLSNAVKFTDRGVVRLRVDLDHGALRIEVSDTGVGIAPDRLPHVFDKFVQADRSISQRYGGTGLGLSICRDLTELMGGRIDATSTPGAGTTFTLHLPLQRCQAPEPRCDVAPAEPAAAALHGLRVLVAEDHRINQLVLQLILDQLGMDVTFVDNGADAVVAWRREPFDLVVLDIQMPVVDGMQAAREIRHAEKVDERPHTPLLALTGNTCPERVATYRTVMDAVVAKPIHVAELQAALHALIGRSPASDRIAPTTRATA